MNLMYVNPGVQNDIKIILSLLEVTSEPSHCYEKW